MILAARYVVPVDRPEIEGGAVRIEGGRIVEVAPRREVARSPGETVIDYEDAAILPGLVNAHTHLELSLHAGRFNPAASFPDWLSQVAGEFLREPPTQHQVAEACRAGIRQSMAAGVTTVGDITRSPRWSRPILAASPLRCVSFGEVISVGNRRGLFHDRLATALEADHASERLRIGLSPHSPYNVEPDGLRQCAIVATERDLPLALHLAESSDEVAFTLSGSGGLANFLRTIGIWDDRIPISGTRPLEVVRRAGLLSRRTILIHCNFVNDEEVQAIAESGASVAFCPRTHHAFGHPPHRFADMLAAGVNVCIGTDSLASNPSLSVLDELRFLNRSGCGISPAQLLKMASINGAEAMGLSASVGSIAPGKFADFCIVPLNPLDNASAIRALLECDQLPAAVYVAGECLKGS